MHTRDERVICERQMEEMNRYLHITSMPAEKEGLGKAQTNTLEYTLTE